MTDTMKPKPPMNPLAVLSTADGRRQWPAPTAVPPPHEYRAAAPGHSPTPPPAQHHLQTHISVIGVLSALVGNLPGARRVRAARAHAIKFQYGCAAPPPAGRRVNWRHVPDQSGLVRAAAGPAGRSEPRRADRAARATRGESRYCRRERGASLGGRRERGRLQEDGGSGGCCRRTAGGLTED